MIPTPKPLTALVALLAVTSIVAGAVTLPAGATGVATQQLQPGEIEACGVIDQPGTYTLTSDVDHSGASGPCFEIAASDVVLDGNGHLLSGNDAPKSSAVSVDAPADAPLVDVTVRNLHVRDLGGGVVFRNVDGATLSGSTLASSEGTALLVADSDGATLTGNTVTDTDGGDAVVVTGSTGVVLRNNTVARNTDERAVWLGDGTADSVVEDNRVHDNLGYGVVFTGTNNTVRDNVVSDNGPEDGPHEGAVGIYFQRSSGNELAGNEVFDNGVGLLFDGSTDNVLTDNAVYDNVNWDYRAMNGSTGHDVTDLRLEENGDTTVSFTRSWDVALKGVLAVDRPDEPDEFDSTGAWVEAAATDPGGYVLLNVSYPDRDVSNSEEETLTLGTYDGDEWTVHRGVNGANEDRDYVFALVDEFGTLAPLHGDGDLTLPVADAGPDRTAVVGQTVSFSGSGSTDDDEIDSWEWDFGDGSGNGTDENETHTYEEPGTYTVTLAVEDDAGNADADTLEVRVLAADTTAPVADAGADVTTVVGTAATLDGSASTDDVGVERYRWTFGDGTNATDAVVDHVYDAAGTYAATLVATDAAGNTDTDVVNVTVLEADTKAPVADAGTADTSVAGTSVELDAAGSTDDVGIASYEWDFGDGETATGEAVSHAYDTAGTYTATLTATDAAGNTDTDTVELTVTDADTELPVADAGADRRVRVGRPVVLDGRDSSDDARVASHSWNFGDGSHGHGATVAHTYARTGTYTVTLTVEDPSGNASSTTATVVVAENVSDGGGVGHDAGNTAAPAAHSVHANVSYPATREANVLLQNLQPGRPARVHFRFQRRANTCHVLESLHVTSGRYGSLGMQVRQSSEPPADVPAVDVGGEPFGYFEVDRRQQSSRVERATFAFRLARSCLDVDASDIVLYRYADGEWTALDTAALSQAGNEWRFRATSNGTSAFAIGRSAGTGGTATPPPTAGPTTTPGTTEPAGGTTEPATPGGETTTQPGFGTLVALLALFGGGLLAIRTRQR